MQSKENNHLLKVEKIGKSYGMRRVVRNITMQARSGEVVGLLGPNGAGKTTSFYMITGLVSADYGHVFLDDIDLVSLPIYARAQLGIGYLPQEASVFRGLTVEQNIMAVLEYWQSDQSLREAELEKLLTDFSIEHLRQAQAVTLSGGERRRVEIARTLATKPKFILLDEPLAGIDPINVNEIKQVISQLKHQGVGVIITDHNVRETLSIVDRAYIIYDGNVLAQGTPQEIVANKDARRLYLGEEFKYS
jgi:lipopolysaccharide export system ATP-binding protein